MYLSCGNACHRRLWKVKVYKSSKVFWGKSQNLSRNVKYSNTRSHLNLIMSKPEGCSMEIHLHMGCYPGQSMYVDFEQRDWPLACLHMVVLMLMQVMQPAGAMSASLDLGTGKTAESARSSKNDSWLVFIPRCLALHVSYPAGQL